MTLETFTPTPKRIRVVGRDIEIMPLRMRQLHRFAQGVHPVVPHLRDGKMTEAIALHADGVLDAVIVATDLDRNWVGELHPDAFAELAGAVFEVNADFFARRVLPATRAASQKLQAAILASLGEPSSPTSPSGATGSPTSST